MKRRTFIRQSAAAATACSLLSPGSFAGKADAVVKLAFIGVGLRGQNHLDNALRRNDVEVVAICDIDAKMLDRAKAVVSKSGKPMPKVITGDPYAYRNLLDLKNIDAVIIATPWEWHCPMVIDSLRAGIKYVGSEVMLGITLDDHWQVVHEAEKQQANVSMLENVCYRRDVMAILNMVRKGIFGELIHLQGGYQHDLRGIKFNNGTAAKGAEFGPAAFSEARWRTNHSVHRNGDLYPTHGIGPIAQLVDINHGNRFLSLSSFSSKSRGLHDYVVKVGGDNHPNAKINFKLGDVVTTQLKCVNGETILLQHDTNLPRPYSLGFRVQGTHGIWMDVNKSIYIEGMAAKEDEWEDAKSWLEKYDHPLWARWSKDTANAGHGGMDFFVLHGFIEAAKRRLPTPLDVYDAACWSAITPLSEKSIELGNATVDFPDFSSGRWMNRKNEFALTDEY